MLFGLICNLTCVKFYLCACKIALVEKITDFCGGVMVMCQVMSSGSCGSIWAMPLTTHGDITGQSPPCRTCGALVGPLWDACCKGVNTWP